jgi:hypothetical protein
MESAHKYNNTKNRMSTNIANWTQNEQAKQSRVTLERTHEVREHVASLPFKRVNSDATTGYTATRCTATRSAFIDGYMMPQSASKIFKIIHFNL